MTRGQIRRVRKLAFGGMGGCRVRRARFPQHLGGRSLAGIERSVARALRWLARMP